MSSLSLNDLSRHFGSDVLYRNHNLVKEIINMLLLRINKQVVIVESEALYFYGDRSAERVVVPLDEQSLSMCAGLFDQDQHVNEVEAFSNIKYRDITRIYYHLPVVMIITKCAAASRRGAAYMIELGRIPDKYEVTIERESLSAFFEGNGLPHLSALYPEEKCSSDMIHGVIKDDPWVSDISINIVREKMVSLNIEMPSSYTDEPKPVTGAPGYSTLPRSDTEYEFYLIGDMWNIRYKDEFSAISSRSAWGLCIVNYFLSKPNECLSVDDLSLHFPRLAGDGIVHVSDAHEKDIKLKINDGDGFGFSTALGKDKDLIMSAKKQLKEVIQDIEDIERTFDDNPVHNKLEIEELYRKKEKLADFIRNTNKDRGDSMASEFSRKKNLIHQTLKRVQNAIESNGKLVNFSGHIKRHIRYDRPEKCYIYSPGVEIKWKTTL